MIFWKWPGNGAFWKSACMRWGLSVHFRLCGVVCANKISFVVLYGPGRVCVCKQ